MKPPHRPREHRTPPVSWTTCQQRAEGDEFVCGRCGLRWERGEDRPVCLRDK